MRYFIIIFTWKYGTRWMIMSQNDGGCHVLQCIMQDFTWLRNTSIHCSNKNGLLMNNFILRIQIKGNQVLLFSYGRFPVEFLWANFWLLMICSELINSSLWILRPNSITAWSSMAFTRPIPEISCSSSRVNWLNSFKLLTELKRPCAIS